MKVLKSHKHLAVLLSAAFFVIACGDKNNKTHFQEVSLEQEGKIETRENPVDENVGKEVFRSETFGNEGFWTDAARLPQGLQSRKITPLGLLKWGVSINTNHLDPSFVKMLNREILKEGIDGKLLNSSETTTKLLNANAFIGLVVKDTNQDGKLDINSGDKMGVSCVLCHGATDKSLFELRSGGSIGNQVDGAATHRLNLGAILSAASNTRAFFPLAQIKDEEGKSIGRAPADFGLTKESTEAEFDAYFSHPQYYPVGTFDDTMDGFGNPMRIAPAFRVDLSAPFGSAGEFETIDQYANHYFTGPMDPTNILTKAGRQFMERISGSHGLRLTEDYAEVLKLTGVKDYPFVKSDMKGTNSSLNALLGVRVNEDKLYSLKKYLTNLRAPKGLALEKSSISHGEALFKSAQVGCVSCHNADQTTAVMKDIVDMNVIFRGDNPVAFRKRDRLIRPLQDTAGSTYDDKMIVINAGMRGLNRGVAMPLLMDLAKKPAYLHDGSVSSLYKLLDPVRGDKAPHAFYIESANDRSDIVAYLKSLDDTKPN